MRFEMENVVTAVTLSASDVATLRTNAENFARLEGSRDAILREVCRVIGSAPTYEQWEACRAAMIEGYRATKPQATDEACRKFFSRLIGAARLYANDEGFDFPVEPTKPKAETPDAVRKQASRANPFEGMKAADIRADMETIGTNIKAADPAAIPSELVINYNKAAKALLKAEKAEAKAAGKAAADALKPRRDAIAKIIKDADATTLALVESALATTDEKRARSAWALLLAACPRDILLSESAVSMSGSRPQKPRKSIKDSVAV